LKELSSLVKSKLTILTDPPGADVYIREYSDTSGQWVKLGSIPTGMIHVENYKGYFMDRYEVTNKQFK
jgi:hypothetical protein